MLPVTRIAELLQPFLGDETVPPALFDQLHAYLDLLLRWNARMNLTAVRSPEQIVTRHFGESLFASRVLQRAGLLAITPSLSDIGSGAGFPGVPIKLLTPAIPLTLIESQNKKATFLREVLRTLKLTAAEVFCGRAEAWDKAAAIVTLRAVEKFETVLPVAVGLVAPGGTLCLLIGEAQLPKVRSALRCGWYMTDGQVIPDSQGRIVYLASRTR
ncbi:MAG TPA: 16S rRNA (guanine(527)-N(7))-methyltransferase RsmG [Dongiaceae bacterium]|nr:16S rRNA (guanine(527)-N(7))-methyltransferase RsmG [Dongiaceae bacterium]